VSAAGQRGAWSAAGVAVVLAGLGSGFGWAMARENGRLLEIERRARVDEAREIVRLTAERERLRARLPSAEERRRLDEEQAALARLRAEIEALQTKRWPKHR